MADGTAGVAVAVAVPVGRGTCVVGRGVRLAAARVALANSGQWHHLAYVVSNSGNTWYVDGVRQNPTYLIGSPATKFFFASIAAGSNTRYDVGTTDVQSGTFKGIIDDLRIYARPLTQAEIHADMTAPAG